MRQQPMAVFAVPRDQPGVSANVCAFFASGDGVEDDQARVVYARIGVDKAAVERVLQARAPFAGGELDAEGRRQALAAAEMVIQKESRAYHPRRSQMWLVRQHELQRCDDMRRGAKKYFALGKRLGHEPEFVVLEIPQTAVDQLGAPRRRMRGKVVFFDQQCCEAASRRIARNTRAVDAATDNGEIVHGSIRKWHR